MGNILKMRKLTTAGEVILLVVVVAVITTVAYFTIPTKTPSNTPTVNVTDTLTNQPQVVTETPPNVVNEQPTQQVATVKPMDTVTTPKPSSIKVAKKRPSAVETVTSKAKKKEKEIKKDGRENLNIQF